MNTNIFNKKITLNSISAQKLINKIKYDKKNPINIPKINIKKELEESKKNLQKLLFH